jgi:hypothetical protein
MICIKCAQEECILENRNSAIDNMDTYVHHDVPQSFLKPILVSSAKFAHFCDVNDIVGIYFIYTEAVKRENYRRSDLGPVPPKH